MFAALYAGATPVLVDVEPDTWTIRVDEVAAKVGPRTRAILPVHMYGHPCDMNPLRELATRHNLWVLEDAAEAHGAEYHGRKCGGLGDAACFSFYANKILSTGEGGMVVTNDASFAEQCRSLKNLGFNRERRFLHDSVGFNYRMTNLQAAIGLAQLEAVEAARGRATPSRGQVHRGAARTSKACASRWSARGPATSIGCTAMVVEDSFGCSRDELMAGLAERGVETRTFFMPMHEQPVFHERGLFRGEHYPVASDIGRRGLYLPSSTGLSDADLTYVVDAVRDVQRAARSRALVVFQRPPEHPPVVLRRIPGQHLRSTADERRALIARTSAGAAGPPRSLRQLRGSTRIAAPSVCSRIPANVRRHHRASHRERFHAPGYW